MQGPRAVPPTLLPLLSPKRIRSSSPSRYPEFARASVPMCLSLRRGLDYQPQSSYAIVGHGREALICAAAPGDCNARLYHFAGSQLRPLATLGRHYDVVTCVTASEDGGVLVTGSQDTTCIVWTLPPAMRTGAAVTLHARLCGHDDTVSAVGVRRDVDVVASGSGLGRARAHLRICLHVCVGGGGGGIAAPFASPAKGTLLLPVTRFPLRYRPRRNLPKSRSKRVCFAHRARVA